MIMTDNEHIPSERSEGGLNLFQLFGDIDWVSVNLGEQAEQWRKELCEIEEENVRSLMEIANKSQSVLPSLVKAIDEVGTVDDLLADYCQKLQLMGSEIQQIEQLNRGLSIQTANQQSLLHELNTLIDKITVSDDVVEVLEKESLEVVGNVPKITNAAVVIHKLLANKFEDGLGSMMAVTERAEKYLEGKQRSKKSNVKLAGFDEIIPFLEGYTPLLSGLRVLDMRKHREVIESYQQEMGTIFRKEFADFLENIRANRLIRKTADEKSYLFVSLHPTGDKLIGSVSSVGEKLINIGHQRGQTPSDRDFGSIDPFELQTFPNLSPHEYLSADQALHYFAISITLLMEQQQSVAARIFYGLDEHCEDERLIKLIEYSFILHQLIIYICSAMMLAIFSSLDELLSTFAESITKADNRYPESLLPLTILCSTAIEMLVTLDQRLPQIQDDLPVLARILVSLRRRLLVSAEAFINDQVTVIDSMKFSARKRSGVFPFVSIFPTFIDHMERTIGKSSPVGTARDILNKGYEKITTAIFRSLDALALEAERGADEKERINASVMNIQNSHYLVTQLNALRNSTSAVETSLQMAKARYDKHLSLYSSLSLRRFFSRLTDFFEGMSQMLENTPPEEIAFHASYNKASAKRILQAYPVREVRKNLEAVYSRVVKHFDDDRALQQVVWRSVQDEFLKDSTNYTDFIQKVYPGTDVQLNYSVADAMACFSEIASYQ